MRLLSFENNNKYILGVDIVNPYIINVGFILNMEYLSVFFCNTYFVFFEILNSLYIFTFFH